MLIDFLPLSRENWQFLINPISLKNNHKGKYNQNPKLRVKSVALYNWNVSSLSPSSMHSTCVFMSTQFWSGNLYICSGYSIFTRKGKTFPLPFSKLHCKVAPPLTNFVNYPLCFLTAFCSDVISRLFSKERGGASDSKNPDLYTEGCMGEQA